jgi:hypothetical protein
VREVILPLIVVRATWKVLVTAGGKIIENPLGPTWNHRNQVWKIFCPIYRASLGRLLTSYRL